MNTFTQYLLTLQNLFIFQQSYSIDRAQGYLKDELSLHWFLWYYLTFEALSCLTFVYFEVTESSLVFLTQLRFIFDIVLIWKSFENL